MRRKADHDPRLWQALLEAVKAARGANALRGRCLAQPEQHRLLIERPARADESNSSWLVIEVGPYAAATRCRLPSGETLSLSAYPDADAFVAAVAHHARGGRPYLRTTDDTTEYKPGFRPRLPR